MNDFDRFCLLCIRNVLRKQKREVLRFIGRRYGVSLTDVAVGLGFSLPLTSYHLEGRSGEDDGGLVGMGLVESSGKFSKKVYVLTKLGHEVVRMIR